MFRRPVIKLAVGCDPNNIVLRVFISVDEALLRGFGEAEYWFSLIKVATVIIFIVVGVAMIVGIFKGAEPAGWSNWKSG